MTTRIGAGIDRALVRAASFGLDHPRATLGLVALAVALAIGSGLGMTFKADVSDLMPAETASAHRLLEQSFGAGDSAFVLLTAGRPAPAELVAVAELVARSLGGDDLVRSVSHGWSAMAEKMTSPELLASAFLFARSADLPELDALLAPSGVAAQVRKQALQLGLPGLDDRAAWIARDPLELRRFLVARGTALRGGFRFAPGSLHFLAEDGRALLIRIDGLRPCSDIDAAKVLLGRIEAAARAAIDAVESRASPPLVIEAGITGGYAYASEMEAVVRADLTWNNAGSMLLCLVLMAIAYRRWRLLGPSLAALAAGMVAGFGIYSIFQRQMVTLAFVSGAALAGLGIDYMIYITLRAAAGPQGMSRSSILAAVAATGRPILLAAVATAAGFLTFPLAGERFLSDVGGLSAAGILACAAAAIIALPAMLQSCIQRRPGARAGAPAPRILEPFDFGASWLTALGLRWPRAAAGISLALAAASAVYLAVNPPAMEQDLRRMQPADSNAVRTQAAITARLGGAETPLLIILGDGEESGGEAGERAVVEAANRLEAPLAELLGAGEVVAWASPAALLPAESEQQAVLDRLGAVDAASLVAAFAGALEEHGFDVQEMAGAIETFRRALRPTARVTPRSLRELGLAAEVDRMVAARDGQAHGLIAVHPAEQLWRSSDQERLAARLREAMAAAGAHGTVTGLQILSTRQAEDLLEEFLFLSAAAFAAVAGIVIVCLRTLLGSIFALLPVVLGTLWMMAGCGLLGVPLNFMNVGVLPMVLGTGVDIGIHLAVQYLDDRRGDVAALVADAGGSIQLASLTTLAAFGTMIWSASPGLASVGVMSTLGTIGCLLASLVTLPAALVLHARRRRLTPPAA